MSSGGNSVASVMGRRQSLLSDPSGQTPRLASLTRLAPWNTPARTGPQPSVALRGRPSGLRVLDAHLLALQLGAVQALQRLARVVGREVDEREALQHPDLADRLLGDHGALGEGPADVVVVDAAAPAAVDEELGVLGLRRLAGPVAVSLADLGLADLGRGGLGLRVVGL